MRLVMKAKYIKKYRGSDGKWKYVYKIGNRRVRHDAESEGHDLQYIQKHYGKRGPGKGGARPITSKEDLEIMLKETTFVMISGGPNPNRLADKKKSPKFFEKRDSLLKKDLDKLGYIYTPCKGRYDADEESVFVMCHDANREELMKLGAKYNQDSILFVDKGESELLGTHGETAGKRLMEGKGHEFVPDADNYYSVIDVGGEPVKFAMSLGDVIEKALRLVMRVFGGGGDGRYGTA
jgi:hypothetical protein